jgi:hypothetical protein
MILAMKKYTYFTVLFLSFCIPFSAFSTEDELALLRPNERYLRLMERADLLAKTGNQTSADQLCQEAEAIWAAYSLVDVGQYRTANPDPLDAIPTDTVLPQGTRIGGGADGQVYALETPEIGNGQQFIRKIGDIFNEAQIGQFIRDMRHNVTPQTQLANTQGFELMVPGKKLNDGSLVQERV